MKTINKTSLLLALIILAIAFSIISMIAAPAEIRYTWHPACFCGGVYLPEEAV